jgi:hypothetical protein
VLFFAADVLRVRVKVKDNGYNNVLDFSATLVKALPAYLDYLESAMYLSHVKLLRQQVADELDTP